MSRIRKAWKARSPWQPEWQGSIVFAPTCGKARYSEYLSASDCDDSLKLIDIRVKRAPEHDTQLPDRHELADAISEKALGCLMHACGVNEPWRMTIGSRNQFYTNTNDPLMAELVAHGLMENTKRGWEDGYVYFRATELGITVAKSCEPLYECETVA